MTRIRRKLLAVLLLLAPAMVAGPAFAHGDRGKKPEPLSIKEQGSFYVNGELVTIQFPCGTSQPPIPNYCAPGDIANNQMWVQYQIPEKKRKNALPVIMVHGGSHTGHSFDTTPDGREGWRTLFLRHGFPVYVVDLPGVARSGFNPSRVNEAQMTGNAALIPAAAMRISTLQQIWSFYRFGPAYPTLNAGSQFPADSVVQYLSQMVPNTDSFMSGPSATIRANGFAATPLRPALVKSLISVEPSGCSVPAANVPIFAKIPSLVLYGDFTTGNAGCQTAMDSIVAAGGDASMVLLPSVGITGNSHMLMLEKNNHVTASWLVKWIDKHVLKRRHGHGHDDDDDDDHHGRR